MDLINYVKSDVYTKIRILEILRLACEISQKKAAESVNKSTSLFSMLESGSRQIPEDEEEDILRKYSECIDKELGIDSTYRIINQMSANPKMVSVIQRLGEKDEKIFSKTRILQEFTRQLSKG